MAFPGSNTLWHVPIVLDFAHSAEGPHDAYNASFANFVSFFWLGVRQIATEANLQSVFVALALLGNAILAGVMYGLVAAASRTRWPALAAVAFLCFAYGLWGATPLGYSELFVNHPTHTQFAISACLIALGLAAAARRAAAAAAAGIAACLNLFMAAWTVLALGIDLLARRPRRLAVASLVPACAFLVCAAPVLVWVAVVARRADLAGSAVPVAFYREFLGGHVYASAYPRALLQSAALGLAAGLAALGLRQASGLGRVMLCTVGALGLAILMPYFTSSSLLLNLHPLRFASVVTLLAACCASACFACEVEAGSAERRVAAMLALSGFLLKMPVVSVLGLACLIAPGTAWLRLARGGLPLAAAAAIIIDGPEFGQPSKVMLGVAAIALFATVAALSTARDRGDALFAALVAVLLGWCTASPGFARTVAVILLLPALLMAVGVVGQRQSAWRAAALAPPGLALSWQAMAQGGMMWLGPVAAIAVAAAAGIALIVPVPTRLARPLLIVALSAFALAAAGAYRGAADPFRVERTAEEADFLAAQRWARASTPAGTVFLSPFRPGFSLFSRRPVWWDSSHMPASLWDPSYYPIWRCRTSAVAAAGDTAALAALMRRERIAYVVLPAGASALAPDAGFAVSFRSPHWVVAAAPDPGPVPDGGPQCPEPAQP